MALLGGLLDGVLSAALQQAAKIAEKRYKDKYAKDKPLDNWSMHELIYVASKVGILSRDAVKQSTTVSDYGNQYSSSSSQWGHPQSRLASSSPSFT